MIIRSFSTILKEQAKIGRKKNRNIASENLTVSTTPIERL